MAALAGLTALAVLHRLDARDAPAASTAFASAIPPGGGWFGALAGTRGPVGDAERTPCNLILTARSLGVTHAVLPCGARIVLRYGGHRVLTEVIDTRLKSTGRQFELTDALARMIDLDGTQKVEWRFALRPSR